MSTIEARCSLERVEELEADAGYLAGRVSALLDELATARSLLDEEHLARMQAEARVAELEARLAAAERN